jgi:hypothetical protein
MLRKKVEIILEFPVETERFAPSNEVLAKQIASDLRDPFVTIKTIDVSDYGEGR